MRNNIPQELRQLPQWVCANSDKVPVDPKTGGAASVTNPETWASFEEAYGAGFLHIGFVLTEADPFCFIDLDSPQTPEQEARHLKIVDAFQSYTEVSQSGRGLHIIVRGKVTTGVHRDKVEVYSDRRYMICTGNVYRNLPIADYQPMLDKLYGEMKPPSIAKLEEREELQSDAALVEMAMRASNADKFNALCVGEWEVLGYSSQSEADHALMAILAYYSPSDEQVRRIFRMSALGKREKAQRDSYLNYTIAKIRAQQPSIADLSVLTALATKVTAPTPIAQPQSPALVLDGAVTGDLPPPPGLVGALAKYIYTTSIRPVPEVALVAALGLVAGIAGRQFNTSGDPAGLNLYLILLAKTGVGKEGGKKGIGRVIKQVRSTVPMVDKFIGPSVFASGQALMRRLSDQACFYSLLSEFGHTLKRITHPKASCADQALKQALLEVYSYSGRDGQTGEGAYSDKEKNIGIVTAPSVTIMGESTPEVFFDCLDTNFISDGLLPRFLIVEYTGSRPPSNSAAGFPPPKDLVDSLVHLVASVLQMEQRHTFYQVSQDIDATVLLDAFDKECDTGINCGTDVDRQLWNRAHLNALKVAALLAVGCNPSEPIVRVEHATWAIKFVQRSVYTVSSRFNKGEVGGGEGAKAEAAIRAAVADFLNMPPDKRETYKTPKDFRSGTVIPHSYLYAKLKRVQPFKSNNRALDESLKMLIDAGVIHQLPPQQVRDQFGFNTKAYTVGHSW